MHPTRNNTRTNFIIYKNLSKIYRLQKVAQLLVNTENNIQEIATDCGFDDNNYFSKLFKRHYHSVIMSNSKTSEHIYPVTHEDTGNTHLDHR
ncbi:MAG: helix-turn-helix domain-containing protein [Roseburia sp.]|uniref:Helix-turn-helix domain-containing protein n=1 Tax=Roseburia intestinalis TaxID=166486 RepID=A0A414T8J9_9FIRM|nr:helix-turn-helix domain-containing protein [Roseburia sp.]RHG30511.1 helix-turn-helix domain-containing protein [Roseburia intestinalis]